MDKLIVYVDDAHHAVSVLAPLLGVAGAAPRQWILVACAPRVTHHVSKWVTHSARQNWRGKWTDKLFAQLVPWLQGQGEQVLTCEGRNNLTLQTEDLLRAHGPARVIDARRPRHGDGRGWVPRPATGSGLLGLGLGVWSSLAALALD